MNESPGWASPGSPSEPDGPSGTPAQQPAAGWSPQQPPPTPTGWGPAPGGPPPQWQNSWQKPPAAKPGVIPLRPLGVSEILDGAVSTMRAHWRPVLAIALGIAIVTETLSTLITGLWFRENDSMAALENNPTPTATQLLDAYNELLTAEIGPALVSTVAMVVATAMLTMIVSRAVLGRSVTVGEAWQDSRPMLLRLLGLSLLVPLIVSGVVLLAMAPGLLLTMTGAGVGGALLTVFGAVGGVVVAVWLWVRLSLSAPALMLERQGVIAAMRRSAKLVKDSWWRILGIQLLAVLLVIVLNFIILIPTTVVAILVGGGDFLGGATTLTWSYLIVMAIGAVVGSTLTLPFTAAVTALLYIDRRIRREALDLELARAAGVEGYGTAPQVGDSPAPGH